MLKKILIIICLILPIVTIAATPLPANKAFKIKALKLDPNTINIKWKIAKNYFLYKNCLQIINKDKNNLQLGTITYPSAVMKINNQGQKIPVYHDNLILNIPLLSEQAGESLLEIRYQGCSDEGFCYPPEKKIIKVAFSPSLEIQNIALENIEQLPTLNKNIKHVATIDNDDDLSKIFSSNNFVLIVVTFLGLGLMLSFTPCVLPMVPVLSGIIVGHGDKLTTKKAFFLSLTYVISMAITYGVIGAGIALAGSNLQIIMQSSWAIVIGSFIFLALALSMFDLYALTLPISFQNKLANITKTKGGGHFLNAAILGSMSILVLSPCVSAPLIGALSYIAQTGNITLGLISLFFLGFGMGIPLLLIGTSAGKLLPKAGTWMNAIKHIFGILMLGVAIYLLSRIIPDFFTMILWAALCIFSGVFFKPFITNKSNQDRFKQGFAIILISYGLLILYGASAGNSNPLQPLKKDCQKTTSYKHLIVNNLEDINRALQTARENKMPAILYFYADWCASCKVISNTTLQNQQIIAKLNNIVFVKVDLTKNNNESKQILKYFNVVAPPTFIFMDTQGNFLKRSLVGEISVEELLKKIQYIST